MTKENLFAQEELYRLSSTLAKTFIQRWDLYPKQLADGNYVCIHKPLMPSHIVSHLKGDITLGAYVLDKNSQARYLVFDADTPEQLEGLLEMADQLRQQGVPSYLEDSQRGGHLWLFFSQPLPGKTVRRFGQKLIQQYHLEGIELFPKQDRLQTGPGSLIRLPFGVHRKSMQRYGFLTPERKPSAPTLSDQIRLFSTIETVPDDFIQLQMKSEPSATKTTVSRALENPRKPPSQRIKESISTFDFISRYVELTPSGRGSCPFHEDQHASFSVDMESNYWHCFAGCGGGSLIDFWMKYHDCDFKTAIHELGEMLLADGSDRVPSSP